MKVLIFGLPGSGKSTLAHEIVKNLPCLYLNGDNVRAMFQDKDFSIQGRIHQAQRMRALADMAQNILVVADFVCPTEETRKIFDADLSVWMNTVKDCKYENTTKIFEIPKKTDFVITSQNAKINALAIIENIKKSMLFSNPGKG